MFYIIGALCESILFKCHEYGTYKYKNMFIIYDIQDEENKLREENEKLKFNYQEEEKKNKQLVQDLTAAISQIQLLKVS